VWVNASCPPGNGVLLKTRPFGTNARLNSRQVSRKRDNLTCCSTPPRSLRPDDLREVVLFKDTGVMILMGVVASCCIDRAATKRLVSLLC